MAGEGTDNAPAQKLPPLDYRPIQSQDVIQVRQLIADSTSPLFHDVN